MTFYNPNIQQAFEDDTRQFIKLKGVTFGTYKLIYRISDGCMVRNTNELRAKYQLEFVRMANRFQHENLTIVDNSFPELLSDIALEVMTGRVSSPLDYIIRNQPFSSLTEQHEALYERDKIQDFIELLVYSDIAQKHKSAGERDFTTVYCSKKTENELEYYTLFERLKLYDYLKRNLQLKIDREKSTIEGQEVALYFKIFV